MGVALVYSVIALCLLHIGFSVDWCDKNLECEVPNGTQILEVKNTMCQAKEHESINSCYNMVKRPASAVKQTLLAMHNTFRDRMAGGTALPGWPTASDMRQMSWDDDLAEQALRWAFQCNDVSNTGDPCRTHPAYEDEGQSLGMAVESSTVPTPDVENVFGKWIREALRTTPAIVVQMAPGDHQQLAEIIFSGAHKIGCGVIDYRRLSTTGEKAIRLVCNYDNEYLFGNPLYKLGQKCTACPPDTSCKPESTYKNLCALGSDPVDETPVVVDWELQDITVPDTMSSHHHSPQSSSETTGQTGKGGASESTEPVTFGTAPGRIQTSPRIPVTDDNRKPAGKPAGGQEAPRSNRSPLTRSFMILLICQFR